MVIVCIATQNWPCARQLILSQAFCLVFKMEQSSHVFDLETHTKNWLFLTLMKKNIEPTLFEDFVQNVGKEMNLFLDYIISNIVNTL